MELGQGTRGPVIGLVTTLTRALSPVNIVSSQIHGGGVSVFSIV